MENNSIQNTVTELASKLTEQFGGVKRSVPATVKRAVRSTPSGAGVRAFGRVYPALQVWAKPSGGSSWVQAWTLADGDSLDGQIMVEAVGYVKSGTVRREGDKLRVVTV